MSEFFWKIFGIIAAPHQHPVPGSLIAWILLVGSIRAFVSGSCLVHELDTVLPMFSKEEYRPLEVGRKRASFRGLSSHGSFPFL
jgi:hypothetical protein